MDGAALGHCGSKPLLAVGQECDKGQLAVFGANGGAFIDINTGAVRRLNRVGGTYEGEMWVPPLAMEQAAAFVGQVWAP